MSQEIPEEQPATKGDVARAAEHMGSLIADSEKNVAGELTKLSGEVAKVDGKVDDLRDEMTQKFDKLFDAVQENTHHIKLLLPLLKDNQRPRSR